jgi:hypothetical protein
MGEWLRGGEHLGLIGDFFIALVYLSIPAFTIGVRA